MWRVRVTNVEVERQHWILCVVELHVPVAHVKILNVAEQCFYGKFISPAIIPT